METLQPPLEIPKILSLQEYYLSNSLFCCYHKLNYTFQYPYVIKITSPNPSYTTTPVIKPTMKQDASPWSQKLSKTQTQSSCKWTMPISYTKSNRYGQQCRPKDQQQCHVLGWTRGLRSDLNGAKAQGLNIKSQNFLSHACCNNFTLGNKSDE